MKLNGERPPTRAISVVAERLFY